MYVFFLSVLALEMDLVVELDEPASGEGRVGAPPFGEGEPESSAEELIR